MPGTGHSMSMSFLGSLSRANASLGTKLVVGGLVAAAGYLYDNSQSSSTSSTITAPPRNTYSPPDWVQLKKEALLRKINRKSTGIKQPDPPLAYNTRQRSRAVYMVSQSILKPEYKISERAHRYIAQHFGISLRGCCHWALIVVDRGRGDCWRYDLMSDEKPPKNNLRTKLVTEDMVDEWLTCSYIAETTEMHETIELLGQFHVIDHPRYDILKSNCQTFLEDLVRKICNGEAIKEPTAWRELKTASPQIAFYYKLLWRKVELVRIMAESLGRELQNEFEKDLNSILEAFRDF